MNFWCAIQCTRLFTRSTLHLLNELLDVLYHALDELLDLIYNVLDKILDVVYNKVLNELLDVLYNVLDKLLDVVYNVLYELWGNFTCVNKEYCKNLNKWYYFKF